MAYNLDLGAIDRALKGAQKPEPSPEPTPAGPPAGGPPAPPADRIPPGIPRLEGPRVAAQPAAKPGEPPVPAREGLPAVPSREPVEGPVPARPTTIAEQLTRPGVQQFERTSAYKEDVLADFMKGKQRYPTLDYENNPIGSYLQEIGARRVEKAAEAITKAGKGEYREVTGLGDVVHNVGQVPGVGKVLAGVFHGGLGALGAPAEITEVFYGNAIHKEGDRINFDIQTPQDERLYQATQHMVYSGMPARQQFYDTAKRREAALGRELTTDELEDLRTDSSVWWREMGAQVIMDPLNLISFGSKGATQGKKIKDAMKALATPDIRGIDDILTETSSLSTRAGQVATEKGLRKAFAWLNPKQTSGIRQRIAEDAGQVVDILVNITSKRVQSNLIEGGLKSTDPNFARQVFLNLGERVNAVARDWALTASRDPEQALAAGKRLAAAGFGDVPMSTTGRRTGYIIRRLIEKKDGTLGDLMEMADKMKREQQPVEAIIELWSKKAADVLEEMVPTAAWEVKGPHAAAQSLVKSMRPINNAFSKLYMGMNPGYAMRNIMTDSAKLLVDGWSPFTTRTASEKFYKILGWRLHAAARGMGPVQREAGKGVTETFLRVAESFEKRSATIVTDQAYRHSLKTLGKRIGKDFDGMVDLLELPPALSHMLKGQARGLLWQEAGGIERLKNAVMAFVRAPAEGAAEAAAAPEHWRNASAQVMEDLIDLGDDVLSHVYKAKNEATDFDDYIAKIRALQTRYGDFIVKTAAETPGVGPTAGSMTSEAVQQAMRLDDYRPQDLEELAESLGRMEDKLRSSYAKAFGTVATSQKKGDWLVYLDNLNESHAMMLGEIRREQTMLYGLLQEGTLTQPEYASQIFELYAEANLKLDHQYRKVIGEAGIGEKAGLIGVPEQRGILRQALLKSALDAGVPSAVYKKGEQAGIDILSDKSFHHVWGDTGLAVPNPAFTNKLSKLIGRKVKNLSQLTDEEMVLATNEFRKMSGMKARSMEELLETPQVVYQKAREAAAKQKLPWQGKYAGIPVEDPVRRRAKEAAARIKQQQMTPEDIAEWSRFTWMNEDGTRKWGAFTEMMEATVPENVASVDIRLVEGEVQFTRDVVHGGGDGIIRGAINPDKSVEFMAGSNATDENLAEYAKKMLDHGVPGNSKFVYREPKTGEMIDKWTLEQVSKGDFPWKAAEPPKPKMKIKISKTQLEKEAGEVLESEAFQRAARVRELKDLPERWRTLLERIEDTTAVDDELDDAMAIVMKASDKPEKVTAEEFDQIKDLMTRMTTMADDEVRAAEKAAAALAEPAKEIVDDLVAQIDEVLAETDGFVGIKWIIEKDGTAVTRMEDGTRIKMHELAGDVDQGVRSTVQNAPALKGTKRVQTMWLEVYEDTTDQALLKACESVLEMKKRDPEIMIDVIGVSSDAAVRDSIVQRFKNALDMTGDLHPELLEPIKEVGPLPDLGTIQDLLNRGKGAIISPENPAFPATTEVVDIDDFIEQLVEAGYKPIRAAGEWGGAKEGSVLIPDITPEEARRLGTELGQESVLTFEGGSARRITTNGPEIGKVLEGQGMEFSIGEPSQTLVGDSTQIATPEGNLFFRYILEREVPVFDAADFRARRIAAREARLAKKAAKTAAPAPPEIKLADDVVEAEFQRALQSGKASQAQVDAAKEALAGQGAWPKDTNVIMVDDAGRIRWAYMPNREGKSFISSREYQDWLDEGLARLSKSQSDDAKLAANAVRAMDGGQLPPPGPDPSAATATRVGGEEAIRKLEALIQEAYQLRNVPPTPPGAGAAQPELAGKMDELFRWLEGRYTEAHNVSALVAKNARDTALLDYRDRRFFDPMIQAIFPWAFWHTRAMPNWAVGLAARPDMIANYAKVKRWMRQANEQDPTVPDWARDQLVINPPGFEGSLYLNLETSLNPLYTALQDFDDEDQRKNTFGEIISKLGAVGPAPHPLLMMAYAAERGFLHKDEEAARSLGYLAPVTKTFTAVTGKVLEPWLWGTDIKTGKKTPLKGGTKWDIAKAGRLVGWKEGQGLVGPEEAVMGVATRQGEAFEEAMQDIFRLRRIPVLASTFLGLRITHRGEWENELTTKTQEYGGLINKYSRTLPAAQAKKKASQEFLAENPEMGTVWMAYDNERERVAALAWDVLDRLPPGASSDEMFRAAGLSPTARNAFYQAGGDLSQWAPEDVETFTNAILSMARVLRSPSKEIAEEWTQARSARSALYDEMAQKYPDGQNNQSMYWEIRRTQGQGQATMFAQQTGLFNYWNELDAKILADPLLIKYYAAPADIDTAAKSLMYQTAEAMWPGVLSVQNEYYLDENKARRKQVLKDNPSLLEYWDWKKQGLEDIKAGLKDQYEMAGTGAGATTELPEGATFTERDVFEEANRPPKVEEPTTTTAAQGQQASGGGGYQTPYMNYEDITKRLQQAAQRRRR